jgi:hypothetical protein
MPPLALHVDLSAFGVDCNFVESALRRANYRIGMPSRVVSIRVSFLLADIDDMEGIDDIEILRIFRILMSSESQRQEELPESWPLQGTLPSR